MTGAATVTVATAIAVAADAGRLKGSLSGRDAMSRPLFFKRRSTPLFPPGSMVTGCFCLEPTPPDIFPPPQ